MKRHYTLLLLFVGLVSLTTAQNQKITLEEIWGGAFRTEGMDVLHSMKNGTQYTVLNFDRSSKSAAIDKYNYKTLEKVETIVTSSDLPNINYFSSYTFSKDESKLILATDVESVFRRSKLGKYYVYTIASKDLELISENKIQEPTFSPDGSKVAFVFENNIYIKDLEKGNTVQVTTDGKKNKIINGVTDWVYEEEFAFVRAFDWNKTGTYLAYIRFDESEVPEFSMDVYGDKLYPTQQVFKYPKAGENNSKVSLHTYNVASEETKEVNLNNAYYIPRIEWTNDEDVLSAQVLNRHQNDMKLYFYNVNKGAEVVLHETDKAYIDVTDNLTFLDDNSFIWTSEKDGYNHIYHYNKNGKLQNQVTKGPWEVTNYYGYDEKSNHIFYQSVENGSINRDVYAIKLNGKDKERLSSEEGTNNATFSADFSYYINSFSSASLPTRYTLNDSKTGKELKGIVNNDALLKKMSSYEISPKEFSTININGNELNMWMIKPKNFDPNKEYPLFMFQYSGPGSQQVSNRWMGSNDYWYQMLAEKGYIIACVDGRGTGFKGAEFKKVTYKELGKYEVEDQISAAKKLGNLPYIDKSRIGIWGWSYGGFMSTNSILKGNDVFSMAIAVAPVTSWRFYDSIYTERYMQTPQENASGYDENSPLSYPELLKGDYLLIHGTGDDNVHVQNTMRMAEALIQANKQFDWAIYPDKNHGIYGGNTRLQLYTKMTNFIDEHLGEKPDNISEPKTINN
ncbi:dipeptidyl aminopeptidase/acylaminoacyl peptidase [Galbibacter orientalis DSM 19592]|uniref:Dipeptidyl aminopeptidase/acylaminoacyl peptidase n=1 Tax=Galbibacter orientalis DSM 19592 TaxID=926559 RepID=I3C2U9_9FLAO|nr:S9 family peptidase [Galbibacter orientalis]EIJ37942.1 dipeptidyl aminopeptidase/acylaminoacyl peptidase [Galbibacter orientalis DSM 19592]